MKLIQFDFLINLKLFYKLINKNEDYITFGLNPVNNENIIKAQEEMNKNKKKLSKKEKIKMTKIISKELNEERFDVNNISDSSNNIRGKNKKNEEKAKIYSREEFFYLEFEKEIISDERSIFEMYLDLLNQCQFLFKFFCISYNIYEDRKLQLLYYTFKINLYFLFNIILTTNNVINKIFDNKKRFKDDIYRSLLSCIFTYIIGIFIYNLTNIKRTLIKRRKDIMNFEFFKNFFRIKNLIKASSLDFFINFVKYIQIKIF